jgi:hypothetical protein
MSERRYWICEACGQGVNKQHRETWTHTLGGDAHDPIPLAVVREDEAAQAAQLREALREEAAYAHKCADNATAQALRTEGETSRRARIRASAFGHLAHRLTRALEETDHEEIGSNGGSKEGE